MADRERWRGMGPQRIFENFQAWADGTITLFLEKEYRDVANPRHPTLDEFGGFVPPYLSPCEALPGTEHLPNGYIPYVIQQIKEEIYEFIRICLLQLTDFENALEVGMGDFGGTSVLFSHVFNKVTSIDITPSVIERYMANNGSNPLLKGNLIINQNSESCDLSLLDPLGYTLLFIDGDHSYRGVKSDFLRLTPFVKGGVL